MQKLVRRNYIHTLGYSARPMLCGWWLKDLRGRVGAASLKTLSNNLDAALTVFRDEWAFKFLAPEFGFSSVCSDAIASVLAEGHPHSSLP